MDHENRNLENQAQEQFDEWNEDVLSNQCYDTTQNNHFDLKTVLLAFIGGCLALLLERLLFFLLKLLTG